MIEQSKTSGIYELELKLEENIFKSRYRNFSNWENPGSEADY